MSQYIFKLPDLGEGLVEAEIAEWHVKIGDEVAEEDVLGAMMTDKAAVEVSSPVSGQVIALAGEPGDIVAVGAPLVTFEQTDAGDQPAADAAAPVPVQKAECSAVDESPVPPPAAIVRPTVAERAPGELVQTSPAIRRLAREAGVDLSRVLGTGPRGRIVRSDFDHYLETRGQGVVSTGYRKTGTEEIKVIGVRRVIAERMSAAKRNIPHFSYVEEVDITELERLRAHINDKSDEPGTRLNPLPFIAIAMVRAIEEHSSVNALYDETRNVIVRHHAVNLGIAVQSADGLKVPVVKHAESLGLNELSQTIKRLGDAARDGSISRGDLSGSTITLSSLGKLGGIVSTPVINAPEVGIVGVNRAVDRPVVVDGQVQIRTMMNLSSSFDHRFVDGYDAARFIQSVRGYLEHPATLLIQD